MAKTLRRQILPTYLTLVIGSVVAAAIVAAVAVVFLSGTARGTGVAAAILLLIGASWWATVRVVDRISRSLSRMQAGAQRYAAGELDYHFTVSEPEEVRTIAEALNTMAVQLKSRMAAMHRQRGELEAILTSMVEGVVVLDTANRLRTANRAALELAQCPADQAIGRSLIDVFRSAELASVADDASISTAPVERRITLYLNEPHIIQVHGSTLHSTADPRPAVLLVLHDITRLKRLEDIRRDFVANVSHELRTPITTIKGFVETVMELPAGSAEERARFLEIILQNANRLDAIISDLLDLSRLEQAEAEIPRTSTDLHEVAARAVRTCEVGAERRNISIVLETSGDVNADVTANLIEQAMVNLIDNAIKYSDVGATVTVRLTGTAGAVRLDVIDTGVGIVPAALPRIFERFYRVDRARSRELGGTGLGLAIVKHIALAHGGSVDVQSTPGHGSTFTMLLPRKAAS